MQPVAAALLAIVVVGSAAHAGGMVLPARGVRTLARAGAFVAGADDADALWQNPAGLAHRTGAGKRTLLFDLAVVYQTVEHTRIDSAGTQLAPVTNQQPANPIPTLAAALGVGDRLVIAGGLAAPYAAVHRYGDAGAQRYASVSSSGTAFVIVTVGAAYRVTDRLRIGATVQDLVSRVASRFVVSACPGDTPCDAEDPAFDSVIEHRQTDYLAPSGSLGVQYDATPAITVALTAQAPTRVSAPGTLTATVPGSSLFADAEVVGARGKLSFVLPPVVRAAVEYRPTRALRIEAALDVELWSMHDELTLTPDDVQIDTSMGSFALAPMIVPRRFTTSYAPALAIEWHGPRLMLGAGYSYETAAAPPSHVSVLTVDSAKHLVGLGGGYEEDGWQIGAAIGFAALADVDVAPADAAVVQQAPIRAVPSTAPANAGSYRSSYLVAGLRFARHW